MSTLKSVALMYVFDHTLILNLVVVMRSSGYVQEKVNDMVIGFLPDN